jgi:hypothetical protein
MNTVAFSNVSRATPNAPTSTPLQAFDPPAKTPPTTAPTTVPTPKGIPFKPPVGAGPPAAWATGALLLRGFAIGLGAYIGYSLPDWLRQAQSGNSNTTIQGDGSLCKPQEVAASYLANLKQDGVDQAVKAIPPKVFEWSTPNGYKLSVKQGWGKDGLVYTTTLRGPQGQTFNIPPVKVQVNAKGTKVPLGETPMLMGGENFGKLALALRVGKTGLDEVEMTFTSREGSVSTLKLKPTACSLDLTQSQLLRVNAGNASEAKYWAELHLAQSAKKNGGNLKEGVQDLLMVIKPSADGTYRNHGSDALAVLTTPLNLLKKAGVDLRPLEDLQRSATDTPRNSPAYRSVRKAAGTWMTQALSSAIRQGKIPPLDLSNAYKINFGLAAVVNANGPVQNPVGIGSLSKSSSKATTNRLIQTNWRELQQAAASNGYGLKQLSDGRIFAVPIPLINVNQQGLLSSLASALKVKTEQLSWRNESQIVGGFSVKGIAIEPRVYRR